MKRIILLFAIMFSFLSFSNFINTREVVKYTGYIKMYGNEPFTYPCLVDDSGNVVSLSYDEKQKKSLMESQGRKICIEGYISKKDTNVQVDGKSNSVVVESFSFVE